ncbi:hypothetical protein [Brachybacterium sp. AOP3-A1-3]|uniref:hypothetical protein n=1 Tax=Brachybacterium sp. AOP3-A1-3 TaxID=3457699 RepID=UPI004034C3CB
MTTIKAAEAALKAWDLAHQVQPTDPGLQSMRFHESQAKRNKSLRSYLNRLSRESRERDRLEEAVLKARREEREAARAALSPVDPARLKGASLVMVRRHTGLSWHRVVRVNAKTVTCWAAPGMDQPRFLHDQIVDVRKEDPS